MGPRGGVLKWSRGPGRCGRRVDAGSARPPAAAPPGCPARAAPRRACIRPSTRAPRALYSSAKGSPPAAGRALSRGASYCAYLGRAHGGRAHGGAGGRAWRGLGRTCARATPLRARHSVRARGAALFQDGLRALLQVVEAHRDAWRPVRQRPRAPPAVRAAAPRRAAAAGGRACGGNGPHRARCVRVGRL